PVGEFLEIETSLNGAHIRGFAATQFLKPAPGANDIPVVEVAAAPPTSGIVAVFAPHAPGSVTKRTAPAGALSLNEPDQPGRKGRLSTHQCTAPVALIHAIS